MDKYQALKTYFGHDGFRPGQEAIIDAILAGQDVLGVMPTGGGKSVCYQVPALLLEGLTVVVSPLVSLMKDQVAALEQAGIPAACINGTLTEQDIRRTYARAWDGQFRLLYVSPERLDAPGFASLTQERPISLVAVDEAHCISQWGQDFRPSYLRIASFIRGLPRRPVVAAFTATATEQVRADILRLLELRDPLCRVTGFDRPNLFFDIRTPADRLAELVRMIRARPGKSGIVYCATRANVEKVCAALCDRGVSATRYHAGLDEEERRRNQDDFQFDRKAVMVATNAFGMGIDKSNVSYVIHYNMPKSLEAYYQEAGRAGRDGGDAECILLFSRADVATARYLIDHSGQDLDQAEQRRHRRQDMQRLRAMTGYCQTGDCLRGYILDYFGQSHDAACGNCGNCLGQVRRQDITVQAQMILSCVVRIGNQLGYTVGRTLLVQVLRGSRDQRVLDLRLDGLSTYGLLRQNGAPEVMRWIDCLEREGYLRTDPEHGAIETTPAASRVLFGGEKVSLLIRQGREEKKAKPSAVPAVPPEREGLLEALKQERARVARTESVPAYVVFTNAALTDMAAKAPRTMEALLSVSGVGQVKANRYGKRFLKVIREHVD